jgi:hypothetical protein
LSSRIGEPPEAGCRIETGLRENVTLASEHIGAAR